MKKTLLKKVHLLLCAFLLLPLLNSTAQDCTSGNEFNRATPKRDMRGVFIASVFNLNWPTNKVATPEVQQQELITILDNLKTNGYNTVFLQVRCEGDALYNSTIAPWSQWLTGTQGQAPFPAWDPLTFAVAEAHKRGLELHAWLNPYRLQTSSVTTYPRAANHVINTNPDWVLTSLKTDNSQGNIKILDPGLPEVRTHITKIVEEIAKNYDVDGIHFDDYFYFGAASSTAFGMLAAPNNQDAATFAANNPNSLSLQDWRRDSVNKMIASVYDAIQNINSSNKKNIIFGVSPFGIWKSGTPTGISGQSSFDNLFCDPIAWLNAGKVDYLAPQLYWKITGGQDYVALSKWWNDQAKAKNIPLFISQAYYKMYDANNWEAVEIVNQMNHNRSTTMDNTFGQIAYSYTNIKTDNKNLNTSLNSNQFKYKSFVPSFKNKDNICPNAPVNIRLEGLKLKWDTPAAAEDGDMPEKYVVYAFDNANQAMSNKEDGSKIIDIIVGNEITLTQTLIDSKYFVVSSLDKNNNEKGAFDKTLNITSFENNTNSGIMVYPNPFTEKISLTFDNVIQGEATLQFFTINGSKVWSQKIDAQNNQTVEIVPTALANGVYIGKVFWSNGTYSSFKMVKK